MFADAPGSMPELAKAYALIPEVKGCRNCGECCGPVLCTAAEREAIRRYCAAKGIAFREFDVFTSFAMEKPEEYECPYRSGGRCAIYPVRPIICRLFGAIRGQRKVWGVENCLECPHGAKPDGEWLTYEEGAALLSRVMRMGRGRR